MSSEPAFLLKALSEAGGELQRTLADAEFLDPLSIPEGEDACLLQVAVHLRECERHFLSRLEAMLTSRRPNVPAFDIGALPELADCRRQHLEGTLQQFSRLRRSSTYLLWELGDREWRKDAVHPYQGRITVADVAREMHEHDLERLWQVNRLVSKLAEAERSLR